MTWRLMGRRPRIDALCIYQSNQEEKGHQIPNMREVYVKLQRVIMWLGNPSELVDKAIHDPSEFVRSLKQELQSIPFVAFVQRVILQDLLWSSENKWVAYFEFMINP
jgi:hypothetical protein